MSYRIGTSHYESTAAAKQAYGSECQSALDEGRIAIGKPEIKPGQKLLIDRESRRYFIEVHYDEGKDF